MAQEIHLYTPKQAWEGGCLLPLLPLCLFHPGCIWVSPQQVQVLRWSPATAGPRQTSNFIPSCSPGPHLTFRGLYSRLDISATTCLLHRASFPRNCTPKSGKKSNAISFNKDLDCSPNLAGRGGLQDRDSESGGWHLSGPSWASSSQEN